MNKIILLTGFMGILGATILIQEFIPVEDREYEYSATEYIEIDERFIFCYIDDDCFKFKASACPADSGGIEACVAKNFIQEYNSVIEKLAGVHWQRGCPEIYRVTDRTCVCTDNECVLSE